MNDATTETPRPTGPGADPVIKPLYLTARDVKTLRRALRGLIAATQRDADRSRERGWRPEPGRQDASKGRIEHAQDLLDRLPQTQGSDQ